MQIQPYLFFDGRCEEAVQFYCQTLGAEILMMMRFKESPKPMGSEECPKVPGDKIMHGRFRVGGTEVMVSDGRCENRPDFKGFSLSLTVADAAEAERVFAALAQGGQVQMPLLKTFFSPKFGMVADRFGVSWMVYVVP